MLARPFQQRFNFRTGLQSIELVNRWLGGNMAGDDIRRLPASGVRACRNAIGAEPALGQSFYYFGVSLDAFLREFAERVVGPLRIAALTRPGVSCNVDEHGLEAKD